MHVALAAPDRATVEPSTPRRWRPAATDNGDAGIREDYHPTYYGAFVRDPDGNNIEVVCHKPE